MLPKISGVEVAPCLLLEISGVEVTPSVTSVESSEQFWRKIRQIWRICEPWIQEMEYTLRNTNFRNNKKTYLTFKEQNLQNLFCVPCICMFRNEHR